MLLAAAAGTLALTIAAQRAAGKEVRGPGTFLPALIDELGALTPEIALKMAKIEVELKLEETGSVFELQHTRGQVVE